MRMREVAPGSGRIPPGEIQDVRVGVRLQEESEKKTVNLTISTNDSTRPVTVYSVFAECPASASAVPSRVDFGRIKPGEIRKRTVVVTVSDEIPTELLK